MSKEKIKRLIVLDKIRWDPDPGVLFEGRIQIRIRNRVFFLEGLIQIWFFLEYLIRLRFSLEDLIRIWCYSQRSDPITVFFLEGLIRIRFFSRRSVTNPVFSRRLDPDRDPGKTHSDP